MSTVIITGSAGLIGSEAALFFAEQGFDVVGIDNDMRRVFFGEEASTRWQRQRVARQLGLKYRHVDADIRDFETIAKIFKRYASDIKLVIHTAAQPSHDWAASDPQTDFGVNANGTLNLLEATRLFAPDAAFIFTSTNKVYGDTPNRLPLIEQKLRWEIDPAHPYASGIREDMSIDATLHSVFGASKVAADVMVQEYGRYFGLHTACFRGGCLTGPNHSGTQLHGFLAYLMKCTVTGTPYQVFGYEGKQVRDNIHSADLIRAFYEFFKAPRQGEVYNIGGSRFSNCSMLEAIQHCQEIAGRELNWVYKEQNRTGDHIWWVSDVGKFRSHYPQWQLQHDIPQILREIHEANVERWQPAIAIAQPAAARRVDEQLQVIDQSGAPASSRAGLPKGTFATEGRLAEAAREDAGAPASSKKNILGVLVDAVDYETTVAKVVAAAEGRKPLAVSALAVHGVMTGLLDPAHRYRLNQLDLVVPDGQPVRWALNRLYRAELSDRVYGPNLMLKLCERAAEAGLPVYLYGSRKEVLERLSANLQARFPKLIIAGAQPSRFRQVTSEEKQEIVKQIRDSGAALTFVGLGCPRQEVWAYEYCRDLGMPLVAVGAAFDFHAGLLSQAPTKLQGLGLEWLYRLVCEPRRLWMRYVLLNPLYLTLLLLQATGLRRFNPLEATPPVNELRYG
jgi:CDP-paratose 2-epimerase